MIVLSVGMPRAGSGWHYNLVNDLMKTTGSVDARDIRKRYHLAHILTEANCNIGVLSIKRLGMAALPALFNTFVIKAHTGPTNTSRLLSALGLLRITYIYRDPRDAMFSAYDFGQQALAKGHPNAFSHLSDFDKSMNFMMQHVRIWEKWMNEKNVLIARYEDLLMNYDDELTKLAEFLKLDRSRPEVKKVIEDYRPDAAEKQEGASILQGQDRSLSQCFQRRAKSDLKRKIGDLSGAHGV